MLVGLWLNLQAQELCFPRSAGVHLAHVKDGDRKIAVHWMNLGYRRDAGRAAGAVHWMHLAEL